MKKLKYSPDALEKLRFIKADVTHRFGREKAKAVIKKMTAALRGLQQFENKGVSVESALGIPCDYRMLYSCHNYAFYRVADETVWIIDIYNEKEDFMWKLFGIHTTAQETEDYWGEQ